MLVVSYVLELVRNAGREFARYANKINSTVFVEDEQVKKYERNLDNFVFDTVRASIYDYAPGADLRMGDLGDLGDLGDRLRRLSMYSDLSLNLVLDSCRR